MTYHVVRTFTSADGHRRAEIYRRDAGSFGFLEIRWELQERCWVPFGRYAESFTDSAERAESEARSRIAWLAAGSENGVEPVVEATDDTKKGEQRPPNKDSKTGPSDP